MIAIIGLVFLAVFAIAALLLVGGRSQASEDAERTLATLQAALTTTHIAQDDPTLDVRKQDLLSSVPTLNRWLLQLEFAPRLRMLLLQADLQWTTGTLLLMSAVCFVAPAYLIYLRTPSLVISLIVGAAASTGPVFYVLYKRRKRFNAFEEQFPHTLDLMVSALRAGHSLFSALDVAASESPDPVGKELRICFDEQNYGLELKVAMMNLLTRIPLQDLRIVVTAILIQRESGGNLAEIFDKSAYLIRERFRLKKEVRVRTAQGRLTGWILTCVPLVIGFALFLLDPGFISVLWTRPVGLKLIYLAIGMMFTGGFFIRKIVNMEV